MMTATRTMCEDGDIEAVWGTTEAGCVVPLGLNGNLRRRWITQISVKMSNGHWTWM